VAAHRLADGKLRWERIGLVPHANLLAHSAPLVVDDTVIVGFWPFSPAFFGLGATDGETLWMVDDPEGGPIEGATGRGTALGVWSPVGPGVATAKGVVFPAAGGWICLDPATGDIVWRRRQDGRFRPARPVAAYGGIVVVSPDDVALLRLDDGELEWSLRLPEGGMALAPYRVTPHVGTAAASLVDQTVVVPGLDGFVYRIDLATGRDLGRVALGVSSAAPPLITDELLVLLDVEGSLQAFEIDEVLA
jgi:outer membrane protein assembly factor BamB